MAVSIKAILLSGTGALIAAGVAVGLGAGVAAGLGKGVAAGLGKGVGVGRGAVVCGRVWPSTVRAIVAINMNAAKISLLIASPKSCSRILSTDYTDCDEKEKVEW